ncbi:MAG: hypothetical protein QOF88_3432 [Mycobacterium sp.]|jgi:hypothetical protein|nr:hypothetical protein [Mycobacterium sp.]
MFRPAETDRIVHVDQARVAEQGAGSPCCAQSGSGWAASGQIPVQPGSQAPSVR